MPRARPLRRAAKRRLMMVSIVLFRHGCVKGKPPGQSRVSAHGKTARHILTFFLNMTRSVLFLREKHDRIRRLWTFIGKELASMETNVLDWLEVTAAACPDKPAFLDEDSAVTFADVRREARIIGTAAGKVPRRAKAAHCRHERAQRAHAGRVSRRGVCRLLLRPDGRDDARAPAQLYFKHAGHRSDDRAARVLRQGEDAGLFRHDPDRGGAARGQRGRRRCSRTAAHAPESSTRCTSSSPPARPARPRASSRRSTRSCATSRTTPA